MSRPRVLDYENRSLAESLDLVRKGTLVLPYFQRDYVWSIDQVRRLITSLFTGLPVGSLLLLVSSDEDNPQFVFRTIEGVPNTDKTPKYYLLDGQQRITSLYSVFADLEELSTTKTRLNGRWFLRLSELLVRFSTGIDDIVFDSIEPEDLAAYFEQFYRSSKKELFDQSDQAKFLEACQRSGLVPLDLFWPRKKENETMVGRLIYNIVASVWTDKVQLNPSDTEQVLSLVKFANSISEYIYGVLEVPIPSIEFRTEDFQKAIQSFEIVNTGGTRLHTFDLLVARAGRAYTDTTNTGESAVDDFHATVHSYLDGSNKGCITIEAIQRLRPSYSETTWSIEQLGITASSIDKSVKDQIVNVMTVFGSEGLNIANTYFFKITAKEAAKKLVEIVDVAMQRFVRALAFLNLRCGLRSFASLPYKLITLPLCYGLTDEVWSDPKRLDIVEAWFWTVTLSGRYMTSQNEVTRYEIQRLQALLGGSQKFSLDSNAQPDEGEKTQDKLKPNEILNVTNLHEVILPGNGVISDSAIMRKPLNSKVLSEMARTDGIAEVIEMFILSTEPSDLIDDEQLTSYTKGLRLHDHHIIPIASAAKLDESSKQIRKNPKDPRNSILNRTLIKDTTNLRISDKSPRDYFSQINNNSLSQHLIPYKTADELELFNTADIKNIMDFLEKRHERIRSTVYEHVRQLLKRSGHPSP